MKNVFLKTALVLSSLVSCAAFADSVTILCESAPSPNIGTAIKAERFETNKTVNSKEVCGDGMSWRMIVPVENAILFQWNASTKVWALLADARGGSQDVELFAGISPFIYVLKN